ncbi:hypothetical protein R5R35_010315 [Gryllus longicercus]|uniref:Sulfatase N-terminal domain-containing protein n=1 Tax=Gryllus longicercus TaxID=2509291 RepID=A0AAN9V2R2_9ORTH
MHAARSPSPSAAAVGLLVTLLAATAPAAPDAAPAPDRPHIIVILADDLGWDDVSFHGNDQIPTPNIDALAYHGIILNNHYTLPLCTPSRSALMTGKYPMRTGMQHNVILAPEPWGLPLEERLLPQRLRDLGYATHAVGKWHLGFFRREYTPIFRGFHSHFGYWNGHQDYYSHNVQASFAPFEGYDMRRNMSVATDAVGKYTTRLFTEEAVDRIRRHDARQPLFLYLAHLAVHAANYEVPLQAPAEAVARFAHIADPERRLYAAMVHELDLSVGAVLQALQERGMLQHSTVLFLSDNGAPTRGIHANRGSNWPFKGVKATPWEGGVRTPACIWSASLRAKHRVSNQMLHITDWLPTFYGLAGGNVSSLGRVDGVDVWRALDEAAPSPRREVLINLDDVSAYAALRLGNFKYVNGTSLLGFLDEWHARPEGPADPAYDVGAVLASPAARALRGALAAGAGAGPLDPHVVRVLREAARVQCAGPDPKAPRCRPRKRPCLFDVARDPCEERNLYTPQLGALFETRLAQLRAEAVAPRNKRGDKRADPARWGGVWSPWADGVHE